MSLLLPHQSTPHAHLLPKYAALKRVIKRLYDDIVPAIPPKTLLACARLLNMADGNDVVFESGPEEYLLYDHCIYRERVKGSTIARRYARDRLSRERDEDTRLVLEAMTRATYRVMAIESIEKGVGVGVRDILREDRFFVMDMRMGQTARPDFILAGTVLDFPDFSISAGAILPFPEKVAGRLLKLRENPRFSEGFRQSAAAIDPDDEAQLAVMFVEAGKHAGMTKLVRYAKPEAESPGEPSKRKEPRHGR